MVNINQRSCVETLPSLCSAVQNRVGQVKWVCQGKKVCEEELGLEGEEKGQEGREQWKAIGRCASVVVCIVHSQLEPQGGISNRSGLVGHFGVIYWVTWLFFLYSSCCLVQECSTWTENQLSDNPWEKSYTSSRRETGGGLPARDCNMMIGSDLRERTTPVLERSTPTESYAQVSSSAFLTRGSFLFTTGIFFHPSVCKQNNLC